MLSAMDIITLTLPGQPIPKKNNMRILHTPQGRPFVAPSKRFEEFQRQAGPYIPDEARIKIDQPCNIACRFFRGDRRRVDLVNLLQSVDDVLTHYDVLADDNCKIVAAHDGSRVFYDKDAPRTEIDIMPLNEPPTQ